MSPFNEHESELEFFTISQQYKNDNIAKINAIIAKFVCLWKCRVQKIWFVEL